MGRKKNKFVHNFKDNGFTSGFLLGEKAAYSKIKEYILKNSRDNLPFDVIQNTIDYIESQLKNGK